MHMSWGTTKAVDRDKWCSNCQLRLELKKIIEENDTKYGRLFYLSIQILIISSLIMFAIETLPNLNGHLKQVLSVLETIVVLIFSLEYLLRIWVADSKTKYMFSFFGMIDLLAILPFYISSGVDLRSVRIFRLLRVFRAFKMLRYNKAITRLKSALSMVKEELILFSIATSFLLFVASVGIYYFESSVQQDQFKSIFHCLWWAVVTLTSVGYGDSYPITVGGKIFTSIIVFIGLGIVAIPTGLIASALTKTLGSNGCDKSKLRS